MLLSAPVLNSLSKRAREVVADVAPTAARVLTWEGTKADTVRNDAAAMVVVRTDMARVSFILSSWRVQSVQVVRFFNSDPNETLGRRLTKS